MKKRIAKVLCAAVLGGSLAVTAFPGVAMAAEKEGGFKVAYITRNQSDPFAAELVNQFTSQAEEYADTFTLDTFDSQADSEKENSIIEDVLQRNMIASLYSQMTVIFSSRTARRSWMQVFSVSQLMQPSVNWKADHGLTAILTHRVRQSQSLLQKQFLKEAL